MLAACIAALVGTWSVVFRVFMHCCAVGVSVTPFVRPIRPSIVATSLPVVSIMYMICSQCLLHVSLLWLGRGQLCFGCSCIAAQWVCPSFTIDYHIL